MATGSVTINVMLGIHAKRTLPVDLYKPLRQYIVSHYSEREAKDLDEDLHALQHMRTDVEKQDNLELRRDLLQKYYKVLTVMEIRFPIGPEKEQINSINFTWFDAFKQSIRRSQQSIQFEKAAVVFCLAAVQSQLGLQGDRSTANGLKAACNHFQAAAGSFSFLRENLSMKSGDSGAIDLSSECCGMLERLMLAQAQECFFEKVLGDGKSPGLCAKVGKQVGLFYEEAYAALVLPPLNQHFDRTWVSHIQLKAAQYQAEAYYRVSLDLHEEEKISEEIARLRGGLSIITDVKVVCKTSGPLMDAVTKLEKDMQRNLDRAVKENESVYMMRVPLNDNLPPVQGTSLVKPTPMGEALDAVGTKLFMSLVPDSSTKALSKYTEMVDDIIRMQAEKLQQESELTRVRLKEMDLPDALLALDGPPRLPDKLMEDVEAVQLDGGPAELPKEIFRLKDLRRVNEELLAQTEEILENESREDMGLRHQFGTKWTRPASSTLTKALHDRANNYSANLKQAGESDARIERSLKDNEALLSILNNRPIENSMPKLSTPIVLVQGNEAAIAQGLRQLLNELEKLGSQRAGLEDTLKDMKRKDDILPLLMTCTGSYDDLFKKNIAKYDPLCQEVQKNVEAQQYLMRQIQAQNEAFHKAFNVSEFKASTEKAHQQVTTAVAKYREIRDNINEGLKFYVTLQDAINSLKQQASDYTLTRNIQCKEMMEELQRSLAGLNFSNTPSPANLTASYPSLARVQNSSAPAHHAPPATAPTHSTTPTATPHLANPPAAITPPQNTPQTSQQPGAGSWPGSQPPSQQPHGQTPPYYQPGVPQQQQHPPPPGHPGYYQSMPQPQATPYYQSQHASSPYYSQGGHPAAAPQSYGGWGGPAHPPQPQTYGGWGGPAPYYQPDQQPPPGPGQYGGSQQQQSQPPPYYGGQSYYKPPGAQ